MCRADFKASNGLFRGRNHRSRLGPTFPAAHSTQAGGEQAAAAWMAGSSSGSCVCNVFLCQVAHYANTLFTVGVTVSRLESRWGPRAAAHYQERRRRWKRTRCQKNIAQNSLSLSGAFYTCELVCGYQSAFF